MKKTLIALAMFLLPVLSFAQDDAVVYPDFAQKIKDIQSFRLNDNINIVAINADYETFDVMAIDENLNTVWHTSINGYAMAIAKFKGKIIAIAATDYSAMKGGQSNTYNATLLDPKTGDKVVEKTIFQGSPDYVIFPQILIDKDEFYGLGTRQSSFARGMHVAAPGLFALFSASRYQKEYRQTQDMNFIQFDEKLNEVNRLKPFFDPNGICLDWAINSKGDVFIGWLIDNYINIYRYENGKGQPKIAKLDISIPDGFFDRSPNLSFAVSESNRNLINCAFFFLDDDNKSTLWVGNVDVATGKKNNITETFNSDHRKNLEKAFAKPNKKINSPDLGSLKTLDVRGFQEVNGTLMLAVASTTTQASMVSSYTSYLVENTIVINAYDASLGLKFQQLFPSKGISIAKRLPFSFYVQNNKLIVTAADISGMNNINALYGVLDLGSGQWDKMYRLSKKKIDGKAYPNGPAALWFNNSFYLPYMNPKGLTGSKFDVLMQQNTY
ncbi:hypothetical protein ACFS5N_10070 [Mucilaginibacter ximonensis]|uniref:Uncharacterized protein n=1 Tax=Mucilaginibacter ximonensis TaxID=538021 RepID=A0ABW5YCB9_9SPHI